MKGKAGTGSRQAALEAGAGGHGSLTFNHCKAVVLGCEQNKERSLRPFKEQYHLVLLPSRAANREARHSRRA